jgi:hypothetical protein
MKTFKRNKSIINIYFLLLAAYPFLHTLFMIHLRDKFYPDNLILGVSVSGYRGVQWVSISGHERQVTHLRDWSPDTEALDQFTVLIISFWYPDSSSDLWTAVRIPRPTVGLGIRTFSLFCPVTESGRFRPSLYRDPSVL